MIRASINVAVPLNPKKSNVGMTTIKLALVKVARTPPIIPTTKSVKITFIIIQYFDNYIKYGGIGVG